MATCRKSLGSSKKNGHMQEISGLSLQMIAAIYTSAAGPLLLHDALALLDTTVLRIPASFEPRKIRNDPFSPQ